MARAQLLALIVLSALAVLASAAPTLHHLVRSGDEGCMRVNSTIDKVDSMGAEGRMYLQVYGAGVGGFAGPVLKSGDSYCPPPAGFSIFCKGVIETAKLVTFHVNGEQVRQEKIIPYTIAGDWAGDAAKWNNYPESATIQCTSDNGDQAEVKVTFKCDGASGSPPSPEDKGGQYKYGEPSSEAPTTEAPTTEAPSNEAPSTEAPSNEAPSTEAPSTEAPSTEAATTGAPIGGSGGCMKIAASSANASNWDSTGDGGMTYKSGGGDGATPADTDTLEYGFTASGSGTYGIVLDWMVAGTVDNNDVWVQLDAGIKLVRNGGIVNPTQDFIKVYRNEPNNRGISAVSVDFTPHKLETNLESGKKYTFKVGGRSTKVTMYNVIMYPCNSDDCSFDESKC
jgi:hypothetical protein